MGFLEQLYHHVAKSPQSFPVPIRKLGLDGEPVAPIADGARASVDQEAAGRGERAIRQALHVLRSLWRVIEW